ncbi:hypothetical protein WDU94_005910 [Cyamophila willieti]
MNNITRLHFEITEFCHYMAPTPKEDEMRRSVVEKVREVVASKWTNAKVEIYGSFSTGFHLPTSDIDLVIIGDWIKPPLHELEEELLAAHICSPDKVQVIDKASVPIVKFTHMQTGIKVDISFNIESGLKSIDLIKKFALTYPPLKKLVIVLKQYLLEKKLNEVFYGGISSYSLILMVISFLQLNTRVDARYPNCNLAILLIEFFEFYGCQFNYLKTAISIKGDGTYISKDKAATDFPPSILCIEDPLTPGNDIGRGCYGVMNVKQAFEQAYITLNQISNPLSNILFTHKNILGKIINAMDNGVLEQRKQLHDMYMYSQNSVFTQNNSSDTISSSPSDSDCETQQDFITFTPLPVMTLHQHQALHQSKENLHLPPRDKSLHQLRENTLLQNQQKDNHMNQLSQPSKENVLLTPNQMQQKENILAPAPVKENHLVQQKENLQQQSQQGMQQVHLQHSGQGQNSKMYQHRYNTMDHRKYNGNKNNDVQYFDDFRIHHHNNNRVKYFPPSNIVDDMPLTHHHNHYTSMPFIHNNQQFHSMTFENTSRSNNRQNNKNNSNLGAMAGPNNYHKKAHSFHST